jgi:hypothetical protein
MNMNKQRKRGTDPAFPRLLGERLCLDFINTVEGHINRVKCVKRQMFGRAKLDLLWQRVLHSV